jgi:general secretion pathway protein J
MRRRAYRRSGAAGFTLIETLIATALMAAILTALATITAQWLPNWNRGFGRVQRSEMVALGVERVVADLAAAEFIPIGRGTPEPFFEGAELSVVLVRSAIGPNTRPGLEIVRIAEIAGDDGPVLVRTRARFVPIILGVNDRDPIPFVDPVVLLRPPYRVSFSYAGVDRVWQNTWHASRALPRAIRVTLRDGTGRILAGSTATSVHDEWPAQCVLAKSGGDCFAQPPASASAQPEGPGVSSDMDNRPLPPSR